MKKYFLLHKKKSLIFLLIAILSSFLTAGLGFIYSLLTQMALGKDLHQFLLVAGFAIVYLIVEAYFDYVPRYSKSKLLNSVMHSMRCELIIHYSKRDLGILLNEEATERSNRVVNDLPLIQSEYLSPILALIRTSFLFVFSLIGAFYLQGILTLIMLALCFIPLLAPLINSKILSNNKKETQNKKNQFLKDFENFSRNISTVIITNSSKVFQKILNHSSHQMKDATIFLNKQESKTIAISYGLSGIVYSGTWIIGGFFVFMHHLTVPGLIAMTTLMNTVAGPIQYLSELSTMISGSKGVAKDYLSFITDKTQENAEKAQSFKERLEHLQVRNISYSFENRILFDNVTYDFVSNKKYAIKGESGAGKTTLLRILMGISKSDSGEVLLNEKNLNEISSQSYFKKLAYVPQKTAIFSGTLAENVTMYQEYDRVKVISCLEKAGLGKLLQEIDNNIEIELGKGLTLSGGEERRLDIARALYHAAEIMILDEPTSGLDSINEQAIAGVIGNIENVIIIVVTHSNNQEFLSIFDKVLEIKNSSLLEQN